MLGCLLVILIWISLSALLQSYKCPEMSCVDLARRIPKSFVCNFKVCD